ncbi:MAG: ROK family protein [Chitinivibrionales bacterium]|nr:ROK family protein [Chitinivibrionales bacterium]
MAAKSNADYWVGFDLGATKMLAMVYSSSFDFCGKAKKKTKAYEGSKSGLNRISSAIFAALDKAGIKRDNLAGIGIGIPGLLDLEKGIVVDAPNLGWKKVRIRDSLEKKFGVPVVIINDVDAGVYGEYSMGAAKNARSVVGVFPGTGIGGGCIYEGKILRGKRNSCLEIGHIQVMPGGPLCGCGQRGCLEAVASRLSISAEAAKAAYRSDAPHLIEIAGTDLSNIRSGALAASINAGDKAIEMIVREAAAWIGVGVANIVNLLAPDVIVLGGGLVEAMPDIFQEAVEHTARQRAMAAFENSFKVTVAKLGDDATVAGAAAWAMKTVTEQNKGTP